MQSGVDVHMCQSACGYFLLSLSYHFVLMITIDFLDIWTNV